VLNREIAPQQTALPIELFTAHPALAINGLAARRASFCLRKSVTASDLKALSRPPLLFGSLPLEKSARLAVKGRYERTMKEIADLLHVTTPTVAFYKYTFMEHLV
jgi:hypothetical protein